MIYHLTMGVSYKLEITNNMLLLCDSFNVSKAYNSVHEVGRVAR